MRHLPAHGGARCDTKIFRGCSATPVLHLQNAIKSRKSDATRVARHVWRNRGYPQSRATKGGGPFPPSILELHLSACLLGLDCACSFLACMPGLRLASFLGPPKEQLPCLGNPLSSRLSFLLQSPQTPEGVSDQGVLKGHKLKGTNRAQTQVFADSRRFSLILTVSWKTKHLGNAEFRRKLQIFAGNRRKPQEQQIFAGKRRKPQEHAENRRLAFVPLGSSP